MECLLRRFVALENHRSNDNCIVRSCLASVNRYWTYVHFAVTCYVGQPLAKSVSYPIYIWWIRFDLWGCVIFLKRLMPFYMDYCIEKRFLFFGYDVAILYDTNTQDECRERHSPLNQTGKLVRNQTKPTTSAFARMSRSSCTQIFPVSWTHYLLEGYCYLCSTVNCKTKKSMCFETHKGIPANGFPRRIDTPPAWILDRMLWYPTRHKLRINSRFKPHIIIILLLSQCEFEIRLKNGKWLLLIEANTCVAWWCLVVL